MFGLPATAQGTEDILGLYWSPDRDGIVEIYQDADTVNGRIIWVPEPSFDNQNSDPDLQGRNLLGVAFLTGFRFDGDDRWKGGRVYAPDNGRTYRGALWMEAGDVKMRGFVGVSMLGRTETLARLGEDDWPPEGGNLFEGTASGE